MTNEDDTSAPDKDSLITQFLAATARERRVILQRLRPQLETEDVIRIAPALRDSSPKIAARVVALLARHHLRDELERQLVGLKPGKIDILRRHYEKIASKGE